MSLASGARRQVAFAVGVLVAAACGVLVSGYVAAIPVATRGLAILAVGGNIVTSWSWFGVNELGVGLHSYGFTEGVASTLVMFWISQAVIIGLAMPPILADWLFVRRPKSVEVGGTGGLNVSRRDGARR